MFFLTPSDVGFFLIYSSLLPLPFLSLFYPIFSFTFIFSPTPYPLSFVYFPYFFLIYCFYLYYVDSLFATFSYFLTFLLLSKSKVNHKLKSESIEMLEYILTGLTSDRTREKKKKEERDKIDIRKMSKKAQKISEEKKR